MDRVDQSLLSALERDGRQSFATLAESVNLSKTSCWTRVQALERSGAITGYRATIGLAAVGLHITAQVQVMIDSAHRAAFEAAVLETPAILECATMAGEGDYLLRVVATDVLELDQLLRHTISLLPGLQRSTTTICLRTIKRDVSLVAAAASFEKARRR